MMVYDYKFPTLGKNLFYQYCKNRKYGHLPENCGFHIVNFTDVEYSNRINPIQRKYIPDLAGASETAATLLASLNKGGDKKGSDDFFTHAAENFLASIIYFFVNFHPTGYKDDGTEDWHEGNFMSGIAPVNPMFRGLQRIQDAKSYQVSQMQGLALRGKAIKHELDSLVSLPFKTRKDSTEIIIRHRQLEMIVRNLRNG